MSPAPCKTAPRVAHATAQRVGRAGVASLMWTAVRRMSRWGLLPALCLSLIACRSVSTVEPLRIMTFNVRVPVAADGPDRWEHRRELAVRVVAQARPDVMGTQELTSAQAADLLAGLSGYAWFGRGRQGGAGGQGEEHMGVFYRREALRLLDSGDFWLSDTPEQPGSISWGHLFPRLVTWGWFERVSDGRRFHLFNTHLPYRDEDAQARLRGARLILERLSGLPEDAPVVLVGDFNDVPGSAAWQALAGALEDTWAVAPLRQGPEASFHGFTGAGTRRIDGVLQRGFRVRSARMIDAHEDGRYPSDHFPVQVELEPLR